MGGLGIRRWCTVARDLHIEDVLSGLFLREHFSKTAEMFWETETNPNG